jgi:hypothetical protein
MAPKPTRSSPSVSRIVEVLAYPAVQLLDVTGPLQVFASANDFMAKAGEARPYERHTTGLQGEVPIVIRPLHFAALGIECRARRFCERRT